MSQDRKTPEERPPLEKKPTVKEPGSPPSKRLNEGPESADLGSEERQKLYESYGQDPDQFSRIEAEGYSSIEEIMANPNNRKRSIKWKHL